MLETIVILSFFVFLGLITLYSYAVIKLAEQGNREALGSTPKEQYKEIIFALAWQLMIRKTISVFYRLFTTESFRKLKEAKSLIPKGYYCYVPDVEKNQQKNKDDLTYYTKTCPYWSVREDKPEQWNGYCSFLEEGDWQGDGHGLIWDQVKECGINKDTKN